MDPHDKFRCFRWCTYIGCFLILYPSFLPWYWGNLSVYTDSYFRATLGPDSGYDTPWTISLFLTMVACAINLSGFINKYLGGHFVLFINVIVFNSAMFLCYLAIQKSVIALILITGLILGFSFGMMLGHVLYTVRSWCSPKDVGFYTATICAGNMVGPLSMIQIVTHYINPDNELPDLSDSKRAYFTQQDILDRVPKVFIVLGAVSLSCHVCGFLLTRDIKHAHLLQEDKFDITSKGNPSTSNKKDNITFAKFRKNGEENCVHNSVDGAEKGLKSSQELASSKVCTISNIEERSRRYGTDSFPVESHSCSHPDEFEQVKPHHHEGLCLQTDNHLHDLSPKQVLKTCTFYIMWVTIFCCDFSFLVVTNFYKVYGQSRISDDHFLANTGTIVLVCIFITRPLWGIMVDRLGTKDSFILYTASVSLGSAFWFFTPFVSKWFYFIWTALIGIVNAGFNVVFPVGTLKMFGPTYHLSNYGLILTGSIIVNLAGPSVTDIILSSIGFFGLFCSSSVLVALCLVLIALFVPRSKLH